MEYALLGPYALLVEYAFHVEYALLGPYALLVEYAVLAENSHFNCLLISMNIQVILKLYNKYY